MGRFPTLGQTTRSGGYSGPERPSPVFGTSPARLPFPYGKRAFVFLLYSTFFTHPLSCLPDRLNACPDDLICHGETLRTTAEVFATEVGHTTGNVRQLLDDIRSLSITEIVKTFDAPRDQIMHSIGWLARERKLTVRIEGQRKIASLLS